VRNRRNIVKNTISNTAYYFHLHEDYDDVAETIRYAIQITNDNS